MSDLKATFIVCRHCGIAENHKVNCPGHQTGLDFETVNPFRKFTVNAESVVPDVLSADAAFRSNVRCQILYDYESYVSGYSQGKYDERMYQGPPNDPAIEALQAESASMKQIAELNAQIAIDLKAERDQLQAKLDAMDKGHPEIPQPTGE